MIDNQLARGYDPARTDQRSAAIREHTIGRAREALCDQPDARAAVERAPRRAQAAYPVREDDEFYTVGAPSRCCVTRSSKSAHGWRTARSSITVTTSCTSNSTTRAQPCPTGATGATWSERAWAQAHPGPAAYGKGSRPPSSLAFLRHDARLPMESMLWSLESMLATEASRARQSPDAQIRGTAVSPGSYTGPVRVVMDETQFDTLRAGDVLGCPMTSPVRSVLFPTIGALVTDSGGILSHPAIIAREHRVPAVVATGNATALLQDDQIVTVDGTAGIVEV